MYFSPSRAPVVLLPVDGSTASDYAVRYVARHMKDVAGRVHLLNVQRPVLPDPALLHAAHAIVASHRATADGILDEASEIFSAGNVAHSRQVSYGPVPETIARVAEERASTMIVMGTRGRHPMVNALAGSTPTKVAAITRVPVLLVRPSAKAGARGVRSAAPRAAA